MTSFGMVF